MISVLFESVLKDLGTRMAVGCTYKYMMGGPGALAYAYVDKELQKVLFPEIGGWWGQQDQFVMGLWYDPVEGIKRYTSGTPPIPSLAMIEPGVDLILKVGIDAIREKSVKLTTLTIDLYRQNLAPLGFALGTPENPNQRGSHVALLHPNAYQIVQALDAEGIVPDFRSPNICRIGLTPLDTKFIDVTDGFAHVKNIVETGSYKQFSAEPGRVT